MHQTQTTVFRRIGMLMRLSYEEVAQEPLPERWVDLINYLNAKERTGLSPPELLIERRDKAGKQH